MKLSVLICTLESRKQKFEYIRSKIEGQFKQFGVDGEVLYFLDNKEHTVGYKRNELLKRAQGDYVCFVDDDDDVSYDYIKKINKALITKPDCVGIVGVITTNGANPKKFIHSQRCREYYEYQGVYYGPPNHLNPIKREIAIKYKFPEKNHGEDTDWTMQIAKSKELKTEKMISQAIYYYQFDSRLSETIHRGRS